MKTQFKRISNIFNKLLAVMLAALFVVSAMPPVRAYAMYLNTFEMVNATPISSRNYVLNFMWEQFTQPTTPGHTLLVTNYQIMRRNATGIGGAFGPVATIPGGGTVFGYTHHNHGLPSLNRMRDGRFYEFRVDALHTLRNDNVFPPTVGTPQRTLGDNSVFFMTDILVEARGRGDTMTVSWSAPWLNGSDPFDFYRISFVRFGAGVEFSPAHPHILVPVDATLMATRSPNIATGLYEYTMTFEGLDLTPGALYSVWVEPAMGTAANPITRRTTPNLQQVFAAMPTPIDLRYTMNDYRTNNAFIEPNFMGTPVALDMLMLHWDIPVDAVIVTLQHRPVGDPGPFITIGELHGMATQNLNYWLVNRPLVSTVFQLRVERAGGEVQYLQWVFDPAITPFTPTRPEILDVWHVPHFPSVLDNTVLHVTWEAFHRTPFNAVEAASDFMYGGRFFDPNVIFEITITDCLTTLDTLNVHTEPSPVHVRTLEQLLGHIPFERDGETIRAHTYGFTHFFCSTAGEMRPIRPNTVYYIRVVTRRIDNLDMPHEFSFGSYAAHFIPGHVDARPPIVPTPPLRIESRTHNTIDIAWETRWFEGLNPDTGEWEHIAIRGNQVVFGREVNIVSDTRLEMIYGVTSWAAANAQLVTRGITNIPPIRMQEFGPNTGFEIHVQPFMNFAEVLEDIYGSDFEAFVTQELMGMGNNLRWTQIIPEFLPDEYGITRRFTITTDASNAALTPDTTYAIFFRPFNAPLAQENDPAAWSWWPSFLTGTTVAYRDGIVVQPTVPILRPYTAGDTWLRFDLRPFATELEYEFMISELPAFGSAWSIDPAMVSGAEIGVHAWQRFEAAGLFPDTNYYIWARAVGVDADGNALYSAWSNPISMRTLPIRTPLPPRGLGLASTLNVGIINLENDTEFARVEENALIIEWIPKPGDLRLLDGDLPAGITGAASGASILVSPLITHAYMLRVPGLVANRPHYVRARTILSISRPAIGQPAETRYDYIIQIATNPDFIDAITVFVMPDASGIEHGLHTRMAMSDWTATFIFHTGRGDGEFDSDAMPELFPLPDRDFEITYNPATRTLTFRFRSTGVDAQGNRDNLVDQRFISRLIQTRVFDYTIDMTHYNNQPVANRVIELPFSIISAFEERQISFGIIAGDTTYSLQPGFANTPQNMGFGTASRLTININDVPLVNLPTIRYEQRYIATPRNMGISVQNPTGRVDLTMLGAPLNISHHVNRAVVMDYSVASYAQSADDVGWRRMNSTFDEINGRMNATTTQLQRFAAIGTAVPTQWGDADPGVRNALYYVNSRIAFTDMDWFMADSPINAWQLNRMILAIANNANQVAINQNLAQPEVDSLTRGGMLVPGAGTVTRQNAMPALVRLFEVRTGSRITAQPTLANSAFPDISATASHLQAAMLRAEFLGFLDNGTGVANPLGVLTMGEAVMIFEIILRN